MDQLQPTFLDSIVNANGVRISQPLTVADQNAMSPDVTVDSAGAAWVVWSHRDPTEGEQIRARRFDESGPGVVHRVSSEIGIEMQPCVTMLARGSLRVFWIAHRDDTWSLLTRTFRDGTLGSESVVASCSEGLFNPRSATDRAGNCWVVCERVTKSETQLAAFRQSKESWTEVKLETVEGDSYRPDISAGPGGALWLGYDSYAPSAGGNGNYRIVIQPIPETLPKVDDGDANCDADRASEGKKPVASIDMAPRIVADSGYNNVHVSLASDATGRLWIAYASNRNDARRDPAWLTKWSYVCCFDGTTLSAPAGHRSDIDLYNEHSFQGWEFPNVTVDTSCPGSSTVILTGQSAHSILAQTFTADRWSAAHTIVDRNWGSWKPRCRTAGTGPIYLVSMGLSGAQIQRLTVDTKPNPNLSNSSESDRDGIALASPASTLPAIVNPTHRETGSRGRARIVAEDGTEYKVYFGDLHGHSVYSDAVGDVDEYYHRYRDTYGYDFAALTDHDYLDGIELSNSELKMIWNHADRFTRDGKFLAWYAYEWTSPAIAAHAGEGATVGEGHRHVLYPSQAGPLVGYGDPDSNTGAKLLDKLRGVRALVIPHHTSWSGTDWDAHDERLQRVVEIVSTHGRFEYPGNKPIGYRRDHIHPEKTALAALNRGYKLGFVGGSDSHGLRWHAIELDGRAKHIPHGTRVGYKEDAYRTGMTAILSETLDRESLFQGLSDRRCYATSGVPIVLDFRVNGSLMGTEIATRSQPKLSIRVEGTGPIRSMEIIRSGQVFGGMQMLPGEGISHASFELEDAILVPGESAYYYLRVLQEDGNMAWSSPIWVTYKD